MLELNLHDGFGFNLLQLLDFVLLWVQSLDWLGAIAFMLVYIIATIALVPGSILTLSAGVLFGVAWGSLYVLLARL